MPDHAQQPAEEIKRLQRCINDLASVFALPAMWTGGDSRQVGRTLLDVLLGMLRLDFVYMRIAPTDAEGAIEMVRVAETADLTTDPAEVGQMLDGWLGADPKAWPEAVGNPIRDSKISVVPMRLGLGGELGVVAAGSRRRDFPIQTEVLLLSVAANQAAIGLREARLLSEQKRLAHDLDQRVAERTRELAAANEELRRLTETIPEMLWSASPNGAIDYVNARMLDYTGFSAQEIKGGGWTKLLHPDDVEPTSRAWKTSVETGAPYQAEVRTFHVADRTYRWCVVSALPLRDGRGRILKWHGTVVDMHDWKQAQEELRDTQAELAHMTRVMTIGVLTASIAHEVNQPLSGIITNASTCLRMLAADPPNIEGARETARRTIRDGNRASDVITRLRALFGRKNPTYEPVDLNEAAREVVALSSTQFQRSRAILQFDFADDLPFVMGDRVQLQQVILNLLLNAADAMSGIDDRPRALVIGTRRDDGNCVRLAVCDSGIGLSAESASKLFHAFYTTKSGGMGVGLSVSRSIIESHQGRLWAAPNEGPGATFAFSIPCWTEGATDISDHGGVPPIADDTQVARQD